MANVQCDDVVPCERVAHQITVPEMPAALLAWERSLWTSRLGSWWRLTWLFAIFHLACARGQHLCTEPESVVTWTEELLLEMAASLPAVRTIGHQPRGLRQKTCAILRKLLQNRAHGQNH